MDGPCAIGRLTPAGAWVGFGRHGDEYRLAVGSDAGIRTATADVDLLLAAAIVYFEDVLEDPPPAIEATHADVSELVRHVATRAEEPVARRLLGEAVDAIDDGLAVDEVIARLAAARTHAMKPGEPTEPLHLVRARAGDLTGR